MDKILKVHTVNDYARYIGAPELHPLVSVILYDELEHCRHSLNNYDVYALFIGDEELEELSYGQIRYTLNQHALMCVAPGQIGGKTVATAKMLTANKGKSRLGASVSIKFSQEFASNVSWQKIDERTGAELPEEDITDGADDNTGGTTPQTPSGDLEG